MLTVTVWSARASYVRVIRAPDGVGQGNVVVLGRVPVLGGFHRDRLGRAPVGGREGQHVAGERRAGQGQVRVGVAADCVMVTSPAGSEVSATV